MGRVRRSARIATVVTVATATAGAGLVLGSPGATAAPSVETQTVDTCTYPLQKLKVGIRLTLRSATDNDVKLIKIRASNSAETGSFYRKGVTLKSISIEVHAGSGDNRSVRLAKRTTSPAYVKLDPTTSGSEVTRVATLTRFTMPGGKSAEAKCSVNITDN